MVPVSLLDPLLHLMLAARTSVSSSVSLQRYTPVMGRNNNNDKYFIRTVKNPISNTAGINGRTVTTIIYIYIHIHTYLHTYTHIISLRHSPDSHCS